MEAANKLMSRLARKMGAVNAQKTKVAKEQEILRQLQQEADDDLEKIITRAYDDTATVGESPAVQPGVFLSSNRRRQAAVPLPEVQPRRVRARRVQRPVEVYTVQQPEVKSEQPEVKSEQPEVKSEQPEVQSVEHVVQPRHVTFHKSLLEVSRKADRMRRALHVTVPSLRAQVKVNVDGRVDMKKHGGKWEPVDFSFDERSGVTVTHNGTALNVSLVFYDGAMHAVQFDPDAELGERWYYKDGEVRKYVTVRRKT